MKHGDRIEDRVKWPVDNPSTIVSIGFLARQAIRFVVGILSGPAAVDIGEVDWVLHPRFDEAAESLSLPTVVLSAVLAHACWGRATAWGDVRLLCTPEGVRSDVGQTDLAQNLNQLSVVSASPLRGGGRRSRGTAWELRLTAPNGATGTLRGDWLSLAWVGTAANWPAP